MCYGQYVISNKLDAGKFITLCMLGENEASPRDLLRRLNELRDIIQNHTNSNSAKFILSTIHSSKGLEYDRVFLLDIFDGTLPSKATPDLASQKEIKQYEEDRRLYYVGMTRAKNELNLFNCRNIDSAFASESLRSLPREAVDADNVMSIFIQGLVFIKGVVITDSICKLNINRRISCFHEFKVNKKSSSPPVPINKGVYPFKLNMKPR